MKRIYAVFAVLTVILAALFVSCGGGMLEAGFARLEFQNNTDTTINQVEMDGERIYNSSNGIAPGASYDKVLELAVGGSYTFTAKSGEETISTTTEKIEINTSSATSISFGSSTTVDDVEYAEITLTNNTSLTLIYVVFWDSTQDPNIDSPLYTYSITDGLPMLGFKPGDTVTIDVRNANGTYTVGIADNNDGDYIVQSDKVDLSPDTPVTYSIDEE